MQEAQAPEHLVTLDAGNPVILKPPPSGVRLHVPPNPAEVLRSLARRAESLGLEPVALELFFAARRVESPERIDAVRRELEETALDAPPYEARLYRRSARVLARAVKSRQVTQDRHSEAASEA